MGFTYYEIDRRGGRMVHFQYSRGTKLLTHKGIFIKKRIFLVAIKFSFSKFSAPFQLLYVYILPAKNISSYPF